MMFDPIADMITRIKSAQTARKEIVEVQYSKIKEKILEILKDEGFIENYEIKNEGRKSFIIIHLRYYNNKPVIHSIKRVSKPSRRLYIKVKDIQPIKNNMGIQILSTSKGIMTSRKAKTMCCGGEILVEVR